MAQVIVNEGILEGTEERNKLGGRFYSFRGIPYAEPPVGNLRFKAPVPKEPWDGVLSAKMLGSVCCQRVPLQPRFDCIEACLFVNVHTPDLNPEEPLPVMVFLHGGGFRYTSANDNFYGPDFLIQHGVILVAINYRTDALGFLCLDTEEIPGNAGMKDQVAALRWIKQNIKNFGGDSENITIFGESAGAASTSYHLVSPMSKGLFNRAIVQSGALTSWWAQTLEPRKRALELARQLGSDSENDHTLTEFFMNVPVEKLMGLDPSVTESTKHHALSFSIVDEKQFGDNERFFFGDQIEALKNGIHEGVKVMTGYTQHEGTMAFALGVPIDQVLIQAESKEFFVPKQIQYTSSVTDQLEIGRRMKDFYFKKDTASENNFDQLMRFLSWDMFIHAGLLFAKLISTQTDVFVYKFTCRSERNVFAHLIGLTEMIGDKQLVSHGDDLIYLFSENYTNLKVDRNSGTFNYINRITSLWTNFAKFGNPTPDDSLDVQWTPYNLEEKCYLDIGNQLVAGNKPDAEDEVIWDAIFKEYHSSYTVT